MNASASCALFLKSSASNTLLPELRNCASAETDDYTHISQQEDEWGLDGVRAVESVKLRTAIPNEGQKVSTMKLGYHHRRLLQYLLDHPDFAQGLHTQQVIRKAESLIRMGYIDESWRVTEAGKLGLLNERHQQQQIQESSTRLPKRLALTSTMPPPRPSSSAPNSFPCNTTPSSPSTPRPRLSRSTTFRPASKALSTVRPRSSLQSNSNNPPGQQINKPAQAGRIRLLKLKRASLNSNAVPKGWGR